MGSYRYAKALHDSGEKLLGMISLETIGSFSDAPGSQSYPFPFSYIFSDVGNFIAFVALPGGRAFLHEVVAAFRRHAQFPTIGGTAPDNIPGIGWSDHWSFWMLGYPAIMVTDTAPFRYRALSQADRYARQGRLRQAGAHHARHRGRRPRSAALIAARGQHLRDCAPASGPERDQGLGTLPQVLSGLNRFIAAAMREVSRPRSF